MVEVGQGCRRRYARQGRSPLQFQEGFPIRIIFTQTPSGPGPWPRSRVLQIMEMGQLKERGEMNDEPATRDLLTALRTETRCIAD